MTRFWWVRHGPTHQKTFTGWRDVPADLSDTEALARLNEFLPADALLISSDLIRAVATADALATGRTRLPHDPALREIHFGDWDGLHWTEVDARDPGLARAYWETPGDIAPPGGESWNAAAGRVSAAVDRLVRAHPGADLVVVAHFGAILTQVQAARGCSAAEVLAQGIDTLSVTRLDRDGAGWIERIVNHCP
ncbi:histidine phosphatase family protein [Aliigemmobacter aestuarii]|uniref:Histidine phosphatase family protein n=1 Tax=Aliigemmobacter aestuarii TaxID=1445661 RepID=A0A4S3MQU7_9RHOB|nr:histidine phosphatase family protein [Gemmobacter aestuarii]THD84886.1 histidine phosphatase family protein [Gemmobacter aestuarii]